MSPYGIRTREYVWTPIRISLAWPARGLWQENGRGLWAAARVSAKNDLVLSFQWLGDLERIDFSHMFPQNVNFWGSPGVALLRFILQVVPLCHCAH